MSDPTVPRYEDYFTPSGARKPAAAPVRRTVRQQAQRLVRDLPDALGALDAFPAGRAVSMPVRGLARGLPRMAGMRMSASAAPASRASPNPVARDYTLGMHRKPVAPSAMREAVAAAGAALPQVGRVVTARSYRQNREDE